MHQIAHICNLYFQKLSLKMVVKMHVIWLLSGLAGGTKRSMLRQSSKCLAQRWVCDWFLPIIWYV